MVKEEEIVTEAAGARGYMELLGLGDQEADYLMCMSPSFYLSSPTASTTTVVASPTPYHQLLSFAGQDQYHGGDVLGFQYYGGDHVIPAIVPQKSSPTAECSSSISSMSSSPTATGAISSSKPQAFKKKGPRGCDQRKTTAPAAATPTNKRPRVRREKLGERIIALQQLVSPFGKSDTASVLHEALGYIRFLHDQVQVLSSPYMQRLPPSARVPVQQSEEQQQRPNGGDLRSRGLCLVPVSCTEHVTGGDTGHGHGNGADLWAVAAGMAKATATVTAAVERSKEAAAAALLRGDLPGQQLA
uniref:BHLH domain-containing protein n=1 Tax=Leersia perrieri TaxID=77586 RepID=A0A0D9VZA2_9ORYZ